MHIHFPPSLGPREMIDNEVKKKEASDNTLSKPEMRRSPWKVRKEWVAKKTRAEDAAAQDPGERRE